MILVDILLIVFLSICIFYCWTLNKRINELHHSRNEFSQMVREFDIAIIRAESSIEDLTKLSKETSAKIHKTTEKAQFLMNDITFMNDMGSDVANRLEKVVDHAKFLEKKLSAYNYGNQLSTQNEISDPKQEIENIMSRFAASKNNNIYSNNKVANQPYSQSIRQVK